MHLEKSKPLNILFRTCMFLLSGLLICIVLLGKTSSYYTSSVLSPMNVDAAATPDFIKSIELDGQNPIIMKIVKADNITYDPVIFFSIDGDAAHYITNINPVKLTNGENIVPLEIKVSLPQCINLLLGTSSSDSISINGRIRIKYLNEYVDEPKDFSFTADYLLAQCFNGMNAESGNQQLAGSISQEDNARIIQYLTNIITYTASFGTWDEANSAIMALSSEIGSDIAASTIPELDMTDKQMAIVNIVIPRLMPYLNELYSLIDQKDGQIKKDLLDIEELKAQIKKLEQENLGLNEEINKLKETSEDGSAATEQPQGDGTSSQEPEPQPSDQTTQIPPEPTAPGSPDQTAQQPEPQPSDLTTQIPADPTVQGSSDQPVQQPVVP